MARGGFRGGGRSSGARSGPSHGGSRSFRSGGRSGGGRSHSADTRSFVSGKIAGQYRAKGYSKSHAQRIGNSVVGKMGSTFKPGKGSKKSYAAGAVTGYYMVRGGRGNPTRAGNLGARRKRARGKRSDVGAHAARVSDYGTGKAAAPCAGMGRESEGKYPKAYGKAYAKDYSKRYK